MKPDWKPLDEELARWHDNGLRLRLWWRDDDAISVTPALNRLAALATRLGLPVHLAVIPALVRPDLADWAASHPQIVPVVHGWAHENHAPASEKKAEFRLHRPVEDIEADARAGLARMSEVFGPAVRPMFVPPWNRIAPEVVQTLPALGYRVLSTATPRKTPLAAPGLEQVNTHLDPIDWRGSRSAIDPQRLIRQITGQLADRRQGDADNDEPYGILTHHLVHDEAIWTVVEALMERLTSAPYHPWTVERKEDRQ
ncbi:polysaccharide deacetylase family protein [Ruegeria marina]|uniref:Polysaccharide deacetylase n=1 Tax=Ruegeria marina TaxID=639004 RepID=A0A1G7CMD1_9RHOB|nr:polysaccharide deacetylase family protein [Ruegeria marina]SDE40498.1 hypothetical protein SAMN04488239_11889 [Ruegeria marina]